MKSLRTLAAVAAVVCSLQLSSCISPYPGPNESTGGVFGAAAGAIAGGVIGNQRHRGLEGAAIGGAIGALAGSALGRSQDYYDGPPRYYSRSYYDGPPPVVYQRPYYYDYGCRPYYRSRCW